MATLPLFVTAKIQKISKNAQLYYQKVVNLPFFVTAKLKRSFFHDLQAKSGSFTTFRHFQTFSQEETMAIVFIPIGF